MIVTQPLPGVQTMTARSRASASSGNMLTSSGPLCFRDDCVNGNGTLFSISVASTSFLSICHVSVMCLSHFPNAERNYRCSVEALKLS